MNRLPIACLVIFALAATARGEAKVTVPAVPDAPIENVVPVVAPLARSAVVNDALGLLVIAHHAKYAEAQLTFFRLDPKDGQPGQPMLLKLPKPAGLVNYPTYVTGLAFHPKLPLLYVWQDIEFPKDDQRAPLPLAAADAQAMAEFDHLLIYDMDKPQPALLASMARGSRYAYSRMAGSLAVDPAGDRLYIPNIASTSKHPALAKNLTTIGSYVLHPDGLPLIGPLPGGNAPFNGDRAAHLAAIGADRAALPQRIAPESGVQFYGETAVGSGIGFVPLGRDIVWTGAYHHNALVSWTPENRQCRIQCYRLASNHTYKLPAGHPNLPLVYLSDLGSPYLYRFQHAEGNFTLLPQRAELEGVHLMSAPVVLAKPKKVAVGGTHRLYLVSVDEKGRFKPERRQMLVGNRSVEAVAYSDKFDRIYVGVEKRK